MEGARHVDIHLNQKMIKEMCGTVSFKRGDSFYRGNKVTIDHSSADRCEATVAGVEDFHVILDKDEKGDLRTNCSCPTLASVKHDCQHIAAVLLALYEDHRRGKVPLGEQPVNQALTEGFLTIFDDQSIQSSRHQLHFENRLVLEVIFHCKAINLGKDNMFGIELHIGPTKVQNIRQFLIEIHEKHCYELSSLFTYDPKLHCFQQETDAIIHRLIQVIQDEKVYIDAPDSTASILLIPPSIWESLFPLLVMAPLVKLEYKGQIFDGLHLSKKQLPLRFEFDEAHRKGFQLNVEGIEHVVIMDSYHSVLVAGKIVKLEAEYCKRLADLKQMLDVSGTKHIPILHEQMNMFLDKVVPSLQKLGTVHFSAAINRQLIKTPLVAKLYLDRVKNRLLAGLEFHYEHIVINPLEDKVFSTSSILVRDEQKEAVILQIMEESSFAKTDEGYFLHNEELEYEFLYHVVPRLQELVQIYATTAVRNRIVKKNAPPQIRVKVSKERTNWLEFTFEVDGMMEKQIREILLALEEKRKYYRLRNGSLLSLQTREFNELHRFLNALPVEVEDLEKGLTLPIVEGLRLLDHVDSNAIMLEDSFRQLLADIHNPDHLNIDVPNQVKTILRDYQTHGYKWMKVLSSYGFGGILADDMGLGKTVQSIAFILSELSDIRARKLPVLIICPSSLTYNWLNEMQKFAPELTAVILDGNQTARELIQKGSLEKDVVITTYPLLRRDLNWYKRQSFHTVFFDEAQAFKNPNTQTAKAVKKIQAEHRFALTGTPVENSLEELWSIFHVVFPELFQGIKEYSNLSNKTIARRIRPFLLRRLKKDVLAELPKKIETVDSVELLPDQKKLYAAYLAKLRHDTLKHLDKDTLRKNRIKILAGLTRLRQICCHPSLFVDGYKGRSAKFEQLMQIVEEAKFSGRRVLIFSQFTKMLDIIGRELATRGLRFFYLDGQTPSQERVELTKRFNEGERNFFLISLKAGGTGLNLTGADTVILYDLWWNPAVEEQAADRAHRIGQANVVQVIKLISRGTVEEKINELQERKRELVEEIIDSKEEVSSAFTEDDIREILMISGEEG